MSPHLTVDMLIGRDVPQLTKWVAENSPEEIEVNPEDPPAVAQVATRSQRKRQDLKEQHDLELQDLEQVRLSCPDQDPSGDESTSTVQSNLPRPLEQPPTPEGKLIELGGPCTTSFGGKREFPLHLQRRNVHKRTTRTEAGNRMSHPVEARESESSGDQRDTTV